MEEECEEAVLGAAGGGARHRPEPLGALARSTRFTRHEIKLMYRGFKQECPTGVVDEDAFKHIFSQFFPLGGVPGDPVPRGARLGAGEAVVGVRAVRRGRGRAHLARRDARRRAGHLRAAGPRRRAAGAPGRRQGPRRQDIPSDGYERRRRGDAGRAGALVQPRPRAAPLARHARHRLVIRDRSPRGFGSCIVFHRGGAVCLLRAPRARSCPAPGKCSSSWQHRGKAAEIVATTAGASSSYCFHNRRNSAT